jgi:hypothetical protein
MNRSLAMKAFGVLLLLQIGEKRGWRHKGTFVAIAQPVAADKQACHRWQLPASAFLHFGLNYSWKPCWSTHDALLLNRWLILS